MSNQEPYGAQPAGWYQAQGDPPGTQRYWDGNSWQGSPVPIAAQQPAQGQQYGSPGYGAPGYGPGAHYAEWGTRVGAFLLDWVVMMVAYFVLVIPIAIAFTIAAAIDVPFITIIVAFLAFALFMAVLAGMLYLYYWVPGITGQTPGKRIMGIEVVHGTTGRYIGGGTNILRVLLSFINSLPLYLGWLWPLFDDRNQTFVDKIVNSVVVNGKKGGLFPLFPDGKPF